MLKVNVEAKQAGIKREFEKAYKQIVSNAERGVDVTEIIFSTDTFLQCRKMLNEFMEAHQVKYTWVVIQGMNSIGVGNGRLMKFKLLQ